MPKTVAIIGAGLSGLVTAKEALAQGFIPVIFEKQKELGGVWNSASGSVWDSLHTNISMHTCSLSDFPWPFKPEIFPTHSEIAAYFKAYAEKFGLLDHIRFATTVIKVQKEGEGWDVKTENEEGGSTQKFDFLVVAAGIFAKKHLPAMPESTEFSGETLHAVDYKSASKFAGKKVLVVGGSYSGIEIAADLARAGVEVFHIVNQANWILPRFLPAGGDKKLPLDLYFISVIVMPNQRYLILKLKIKAPALILLPYWRIKQR